MGRMMLMLIPDQSLGETVVLLPHAGLSPWSHYIHQAAIGLELPDALTVCCLLLFAIFHRSHFQLSPLCSPLSLHPLHLSLPPLALFLSLLSLFLFLLFLFLLFVSFFDISYPVKC